MTKLCTAVCGNTNELRNEDGGTDSYSYFPAQMFCGCLSLCFAGCPTVPSATDFPPALACIAPGIASCEKKGQRKT